jgi:hypothetical protein
MVIVGGGAALTAIAAYLAFFAFKSWRARRARRLIANRADARHDMRSREARAGARPAP